MEHRELNTGKLTKFVSIRMTEAEFIQLEVFCKENKCSKSAAIRYAIVRMNDEPVNNK